MGEELKDELLEVVAGLEARVRSLDSQLRAAKTGLRMLADGATNGHHRTKEDMMRIAHETILKLEGWG